jgi:hypothetical protein
MAAESPAAAEPPADGLAEAPGPGEAPGTGAELGTGATLGAGDGLASAEEAVGMGAGVAGPGVCAEATAPSEPSKTSSETAAGRTIKREAF